MICLCKSLTVYSKDIISNIDHLRSTTIIDTSLKFNTYSEMHKYWILKNEEIYRVAKNIPSNYTLTNKKKYYTDSVIYSEQDLYTVLMFKNLSRFKLTKDFIYLLKYNLGFSNLVSIQKRISIYNLFPEEIKKSKEAQKIYKELLDYELRLGSLRTTLDFHKFQVYDLNGSLYSFENILNNEMDFYVIIFGASWCGPCRQENRFLNNEIAKVNTKRVKFIGVSIDNNKSEWIKAINKDQCKWENYLLVDGSQSSLYKNNVNYGIPYNLLINSKKEIISSHNSLQLILNKLPKSLYMSANKL